MWKEDFQAEMKKIKIEKYLNSFMPFLERKERKNKNVKGYNLA